MPPPLRDPKQLSEWLELDYFRRPRRLRGLRPWLTAAVLVKCVLLLLITLWPRTHVVYQAGPLAPAHVMFNDNCGHCHTAMFQTVSRLWPGNASQRSVPDEACRRCHDGPVHHEQQVHNPGCASCHQEHRGRPKLARVTDEHCTACHAQLARKDGCPPGCGNVTNFSRDHPEFALWRDPEARDPGQLRFNHQVHLKAEGVLGADGQHVKLDCRACHRPDGERRFMLPIQYEQHCAACHPLAVQLVGGWRDPQLRTAVEQFCKEPAPHRAPGVVRASLRDRFTEFYQLFSDRSEGPRTDEPERPFPGRSYAPAIPDDEAVWVKGQLHAAQQLLFMGAGGCRFCHILKEPGSPRQLPDYLRTDLRPRWFVHSQFSHDSHRQLTCTTCHGNVTASRHTSDILLPNSQACHQCHNPQVGVRAQCVDCHRYHDRDQERCWDGKLSIGDCVGKP